MLRVSIRLLLAALLALAVACGGDDGDNGDATTTTGRDESTDSTTEDETDVESGAAEPADAELIAEGDAICAEAEKEFNELVGLGQDPFSPGADVDEYLADIDRGIEITERRIERFRDLDAEGADQERIDRLVELQEESLERIRAFRDAVADGDQEAAEAVIDENQATTDEAEQLAQEMGFEVCGRLA